MKFLRKTAAVALAAVLSVTSLAAAASADEVSSGYVELALNASKLTAPRLSVTVNKSKYAFSWNEIGGADGYEICYSIDGGKNYYTLITTGSDTYSTTINTLDPSLSYRFKIRAFNYSINGLAYSDYSDYAYTRMSDSSPKKPPKTTLEAVTSGGRVKLTWTAVTGIKGYEIYYSKKSGSSFKLLKTVSGKKNSIIIDNLDPLVKYYFKIRSYKTSSGKKVYSDFSASAYTVPVSDIFFDPSSPTSLSTSKEKNTDPSFADPSEKNTSVSSAKKMLDVSFIPVSKVSSDLECVTNYLGQDLYVFKEKKSDNKQVYRITKSALQNYKKTKKLKATKITVDRQLDKYTWDVAVTRLDTCNNMVFRYIDEKSEFTYVTMLYDKKSKHLKQLYKWQDDFGTLTEDGYTMDGFYAVKDGLNTFNITVKKPNGDHVKTYVYDYTKFTANSTCSSKDSGIWFSMNASGYNKTMFIDENGKEQLALGLNKLAYLGDSERLIYFDTVNVSENNGIPIDKFHVQLLKSGKIYDFSKFEKSYFTNNKIYYAVRNVFNFSGTKGIIEYWDGFSKSEDAITNDPNEFGRSNISTLYSVIDIATGKLLTPIFDVLNYNKKTRMYEGFTFENGASTGVWFFNEKGKKLAKFDDASEFDGKGYALISSGGKLFMVDKNFKRVSSYFKSDKNTSSFISVMGQNGVLAYQNGSKSYFAVYG